MRQRLFDGYSAFMPNIDAIKPVQRIYEPSVPMVSPAMIKLIGRSDHSKASTPQYTPTAIIAIAMTKRITPPSMSPPWFAPLRESPAP